MKRFLPVVFCFATLSSIPVMADNQSLDAALGGAIGGGLGAAVGNEVAGRNGAIVGGALGAATGAAVTTKDDRRYPRPYQPAYRSYPPGPPGRFCPPGQAKKGRCW